MAEYIDREALLADIAELRKSHWFNDDYNCTIRSARHEGVDVVTDLCVKQAPTADVAEVKHGEWLTWEDITGKESKKKSHLGVFCSECHNHADNMTDYCPHCGAKME